jgi:hypothetical protein
MIETPEAFDLKLPELGVFDATRKKLEAEVD